MSEQYISPANMRSIAQAIEKDKPALMSAVQAIIEGTPIGASSLDDKIVATWEGVTFTERQLRDDRMTYLGQVLRRHRYGGGWVPLDQDKANITMPFVAETAYVGPSAMVFGSARVYD
ncbi:MAG: hypothetical protein L0H38_03660, partial [bacterium]|nr:hypothetical protein [bacterium]